MKTKLVRHVLRFNMSISLQLQQVYLQLFFTSYTILIFSVNYFTSSHSVHNNSHQHLPFTTSLPAPTFSPAMIITISALISTHAPSFRQPSMHCNLQYIPIVSTILTLDNRQRGHWTNAPWFKSSSTFSSKFFDSWKYSSYTQCPSSLLWTHWLPNNEGPFTDRWRTWRM